MLSTLPIIPGRQAEFDPEHEYMREWNITRTERKLGFMALYTLALITIASISFITALLGLLGLIAGWMMFRDWSGKRDV